MSLIPTRPPAPEPEDTELDQNQLKVLDWRMGELTRAGAPPLVASALAANKEVDLHYACRVVKGVLEQGLDVGVAVEILT